MAIDGTGYESISFEPIFGCAFIRISDAISRNENARIALHAIVIMGNIGQAIPHWAASKPRQPVVIRHHAVHVGHFAPKARPVRLRCRRFIFRDSRPVARIQTKYKPDSSTVLEEVEQVGAWPVNAADQRWVVIYLSTGFSLAPARLGEAFNLANRLHAYSADYQLKYVSESGAGAVVLRVSIAADPLGDEHGRRALAFFHLHGDRAVVNWDDALQRRLADIRRHARWIVDGWTCPRSRPCSVRRRRSTGGPAGRATGRHDGRAAGRRNRRVRRRARHVPRRARRHCRAGDRQQPVAAGRAALCAVDVGLSRAERGSSIRMSAQRLRAQSVNRISIANAAQAAAMSERNFCGASRRKSA